MADGPTLETCVRETLAATAAAIATMLELDQRPPSPARDRRREQQINLRVTPDEKLQLEEAARRHGYRSVSDFIRAAALAKSA